MTDPIWDAARRFMDPLLDRGFTERAIFTYARPDGSPWFWRLRARNPETGEKWLHLMCRAGDGFELGEPAELQAPDAKTPLYTRLLEDESAPVWIVGGERKVLALEKLGLPAATSGSATSARRADWVPVTTRQRREAIVFPDNDANGRQYAREVVAIFLARECSLKVVDLDRVNLPAGGDVIDWLVARPNATRADLEALPCIIKVAPKVRGASDMDPEAVETFSATRLFTKCKVRARIGQAGPEVPPLTLELLAGLRAAFDECGRDRRSTAQLIEALAGGAKSPWAMFDRGRPMTPRQLVRLLSPLGVVPVSVRLPDGATPKGYKREAFEEAFAQHLPPTRHKPAPVQPVAKSRDATADNAPRTANPPQRSAHAMRGGLSDDDELWANEMANYLSSAQGSPKGARPS